MVIPELSTDQFEPFWDDSYKFLEYSTEPFNNATDIEKWLEMGYSNKFTGEMCDMRHTQPEWNTKIVNIFSNVGWKDIGTSYYRMNSGTILPVHQDAYHRYIELFNLEGKEQSIMRAIIFLEDWASGHYLEVDNTPIVNWKKGFCVSWKYDLPHMAANLGITPRYTLQITGHL